MKKRHFLAAAMTAAIAGCVTPGPPTPAPPAESRMFGREGGIDHLLIWTREAERDTAVLRDKLGFQVRPGGTFPDQIANRMVYFRDRSYLELLHFTVPLAELDPARLETMAFLKERDGSIGFGIMTQDLEATSAALSAAGLDMDEISPGSWDPDGPEGPRPAEQSLFRTLGFKSPPIRGLDPFYVWYGSFGSEAPEAQARWAAGTVHANTARKLSAVWILPADPAAARSALVRMGYSERGSSAMPQFAARGIVYSGGRSSVLLVEPQGEGPAAEALRMRGPHVFGVSIEVDDLEAAAGVVGAGYGRLPRPRRGPFGRSVIAPSQDDLGLLVEFHAPGRA